MCHLFSFVSKYLVYQNITNNSTLKKLLEDNVFRRLNINKYILTGCYW